MGIERCPIDGEKVPASDGSRPRMYCSKRCRNVASQRAYVERHGTAGELRRKCAGGCAKTFSRRGQGKGGRLYCSTRCKKRARKRQARLRTLIARAERLLKRMEETRRELEKING